MGPVCKRKTCTMLYEPEAINLVVYKNYTLFYKKIVSHKIDVPVFF